MNVFLRIFARVALFLALATNGLNLGDESGVLWWNIGVHIMAQVTLDVILIYIKSLEVEE